MDGQYLGRIKYADALKAQDLAWSRVMAGEPPVLLGFESEPVITLGVRGDSAADIPDAQGAHGFEILKVDRGGQATLHNPGQLVIFPIVNIAEFGAKRWARHLAEVTLKTLGDFQIEAHWDECHPGLYTDRGKIVAIGLRVRQGISTHGLAINVSNRLEDFGRIRACGALGARVDRFPEPVALTEVFRRWIERFAIDLIPDSYKKESRCADIAQLVRALP